MVDFVSTKLLPFAVTPILMLGLLAGCAVVENVDDPCAIANRDVSFTVLVENSMVDAYNACLSERREDIIEQWGKE